MIRSREVDVGRIEAVEVDVAAKLAGRVAEILVNEGDFVKAGQVIARMDTRAIDAQLAQARAQVANAKSAKQTALAMVAQRKADAAMARLRAERMKGRRQPRAGTNTDAFMVFPEKKTALSPRTEGTGRLDQEMAGGALPGGATRNGGLRFSASAKRGRSGAATGGGGGVKGNDCRLARWAPHCTQGN